MLASGLLAAPLLPAQEKATPVDATSLRKPAEIGATGVYLVGDDPAFARPDFDDSKWPVTDEKKTFRQVFSGGQPKVIWQRIHIKVDPTRTGLALMADHVTDAFEVYVNGQEVLAFGRIDPLTRYTEDSDPIIPIPDAQVATGNLVVAIRARIKSQFLRASDAEMETPAFFTGMVTLGEEIPLRDHQWRDVFTWNLFGWFVQLVAIGVCSVAVPLYFSQRQYKEYLWLSLCGLDMLLNTPIEIMKTFSNLPASLAVVDQLLLEGMNFFTVLVVFAFLRRKFDGWERFFIVLSLLCPVVAQYAFLLGPLSVSYLNASFIPLNAIFAFFIPTLLIAHLRKGNRDEAVLLIPVISWAVFNLRTLIIVVLELTKFRHAADQFDQQTSFFSLGSLPFGTGLVTKLIAYLSFVVIIVLRSIRTSRRQAVFEGELAAAREVQQVILPEQIEVVPGFTVESVYLPAQQVGGDFFQVLPTGDGGILLVLGDVAGKGLPAAMLVSVLVGAIRTVAEYTTSPNEVLASLNERLIGRSRGGFSTALVALIGKDGVVNIANAGHLSPYLDGSEIELPGALPLGIVSGASYQTNQLQLEPGRRLTFYSDGVVEAQNAKGELFGFERAQEISTLSAAAIVEAAKAFGQADDITVVAITRLAAIASAA